MVSRRAVYLCLVRDGLHQRAIAKRLKMPKTTVVRSIGFLLATQAIQPLGPSSAQGRAAFFQKGPKAADFEGWSGGPRDGGVAPPKAPKRTGLAVDPHRGTMKIPVEAMPAADPATMPGCYNAKPPSWWFRVADAAGNLWSVQLSRKKDGKTGVLLVTPPTVRTRDLQAVFDQQGRADAAQRLVWSWGGPFSLVVPRARGAAEQVQPNEISIPGLGLQSGLRSEPDGRVWTDPSQGRGSAEVAGQDQKVVQSLSTLPEDMAMVMDRLRTAEKELLAGKEMMLQVNATMQAGVGTINALVAHSVVSSHAMAVQVQAQVAGAMAGSNSPPSSSPLPKEKPGVDYV